MYDCEYVDKVSFIIDVKILFQTAVSVIKHDNVFVEESVKAEEKDKAKLK